MEVILQDNSFLSDAMLLKLRIQLKITLFTDLPITKNVPEKMT